MDTKDSYMDSKHTIVPKREDSKEPEGVESKQKDEAINKVKRNIQELITFIVWHVMGFFIGCALESDPTARIGSVEFRIGDVILRLPILLTLWRSPGYRYPNMLQQVLYAIPGILIKGSYSTEDLILFGSFSLVQLFNLALYREFTYYSMPTIMARHSVSCSLACILLEIANTSQPIEWFTIIHIFSLVMFLLFKAFSHSRESTKFMEMGKDQIKQRLRSFLFSLLPVRLFSIIAVSGLAKYSNLVYFWCSSYLSNISLVMSILIVSLSLFRKGKFEKLLEIGPVVTEAFMFSVPLATADIETYLMLMGLILLICFVPLMADDVRTATVHLVFLWGHIACVLYWALNDCSYTYQFLYRLHICLCLVKFTKEQETTERVTEPEV